MTIKTKVVFTVLYGHTKNTIAETIPGYRAYYIQRGKVIYLLLCGGDKAHQMRDIQRAVEMARRWKQEKKK